jgi:hypothetical protein
MNDRKRKKKSISNDDLKGGDDAGMNNMNQNR